MLKLCNGVGTKVSKRKKIGGRKEGRAKLLLTERTQNVTQSENRSMENTHRSTK